jgi:Spy/CpxP family protein refolding chaperone
VSLLSGAGNSHPHTTFQVDFNKEGKQMKKLGKFKTLTIASLSAIALVTPVVLAQQSGVDQSQTQRAEQGQKGYGKGWGRRGGFGRRGGHGRGMKGGMFRGITLTEDQKARVKQIHESFRNHTQGLHEQLRAKRQELRQASEGGTFNEALATQKLQETAALRAKLMGERFKLHQEMESVLTAEQKTQLEQKRAEMKAKRAEFKAKRGERGERKVQ